jgi:hypothetical protein
MSGLRKKKLRHVGMFQVQITGMCVIDTYGRFRKIISKAEETKFTY